MKYATIPLFEEKEISISIEERVATALEAVTALFFAGAPVIVAFSSGKDSSCVAAIVLHAARDYVQLLENASLSFRPAKRIGVIAGIRRHLTGCKRLVTSRRLQAAAGKAKAPFVVVTSSDTRVENPEIAVNLRVDHAKMHAFAKEHGIRLHAEIVQPTLLSTWQVACLSGRAIPSYAGTNSDCSVSLKILPQRSFRNRFFRKLKAEKFEEPVTVLGTRFDESEQRALRMKLRGERADVPVRNKDGDLVLSPLAFFSTDDVWEALAYYGSGIWPSYSDFEDTKRIYAHSGGTSCAIVADAIFEGAKRKSGKCGARLGCWSCQMASDKSLRQLSEYDERYAFARGLVKLNQYLTATRWDWSKRSWVGRTIRGGYIAIGPDTWSPEMTRSIARMMMTLDLDEKRRAARERTKPMFELMPLDILVALDAMQSLYGVARPFSLWADRRDIFERGIRYDVPEIEPVAQTPVPDTRFLHVGEDWDSNTLSNSFTGMRDAYIEALTADSFCAPEIVELGSGKTAWKVETEQQFEVDMESVYMIEDYELDRLLDKHDGFIGPGGITYAYKWYLQFGAISLSHSQQVEHDMVCRRTEFKDRLGLTLDYNLDDLLARSVRYADLPENARSLWKHKATTDGSQIELLLAA